ncbi:MAG: hypothetical protein Q9167_007715 [Letrouitia subvulpina]
MEKLPATDQCTHKSKPVGLRKLAKIDFEDNRAWRLFIMARVGSSIISAYSVVKHSRNEEFLLARSAITIHGQQAAGYPGDLIFTQIYTTKVYIKNKKVDLEQPVRYEAISYRWSDPNPRFTVHYNEQEIPVGENLVNALNLFRYTDQSRVLWTDQLYINQKD